MATMQRLRNNMHIVLWALLILFLLSMTIGGLVGGANITDLFSKSKRLQGKAGAVNGNKLDAMDYSKMVQNQLDQYRDNGQEITETIIERVSDQVWQSYINEILLSKMIDHLGLNATNHEIFEYLMQYPPDFLKTQEAFQTDGHFDQDKYLQALTNPQGNEWLGVEQYLRGIIPYQKIQNLIQNLPAISELKVREEYIKTKVPFTLETLVFPFSMVADDSVSVSDKEIVNYYTKHKKDYYVDETREMKYAYFEIKPTRDDTLSRYQLATDLINRINKGEAFETIAAEYTEDPSGKNNGGDLGWFDQHQMVAPFSKAAFALKKGKISQPVLTQFGYHIIKVEDKRVQNGTPQVKARHILLKITPGPETLDNIRSQANLFAFDAAEYGFEAAADSHNVEIKTTGKLSNNSHYIPGLGSFKRAIQFAFADNPVGTLSELLGAENGYAIFKLIAVNPAYYKPIDEVRDAIKTNLVTEKRINALKKMADKAYADIKSGTELKAVPDSFPDIKYELHKDVLLNRPLKGLSRSMEIIGTVLALEDGQTASPIKVGNQYAIIKKLSHGNIDEKDFGVQKELIRDKLLKQARTDYYNKWLAELKKDAKIIDNRENMYY